MRGYTPRHQSFSVPKPATGYCKHPPPSRRAIERWRQSDRLSSAGGAAHGTANQRRL